jgi:hypothetical protein
VKTARKIFISAMHVTAIKIPQRANNQGNLTTEVHRDTFTTEKTQPTEYHNRVKFTSAIYRVKKTSANLAHRVKFTSVRSIPVLKKPHSVITSTL